MTPPRSRRFAARVFAALLVVGWARGAWPEPRASAEPPGGVVHLAGILRGVDLQLPPYFRYTPKDDVRAGVLGTLEGTTREFESITVEFGADRSVLTAPQRAGFEAFRIRHVVERGEAAETDLKPDGSIVRLKNPFRDGVYACAVRQVGRTAVWARGASERKHEAGLVRLLKAVVAGVGPQADDVDGWLPGEVKTSWTHAPSPDLLLVHDGALDEARLAAILVAVRAGHAVVKKLLGPPAAGGPPLIVRVTANRDLFAHLAQRRDLREADAHHLAWAGELLVAPRSSALDGARVAAEAAAQMLHHRLGAEGGEPLRAGLRRQASASVGGAPLLDDAASLARVRSKEAQTWYRLLMLPTLTRFLAERAEERELDAELSVVYLGQSGAAVGKASLAAWVSAFSKWGHPDAGAEGAVAGMDPAKSDAEYWAYWTARADPPAKPSRGRR